MNDVLSQDEIDQLLTAISSGDSGDTDDFKPVNSARKIKIYDFSKMDEVASIEFEPDDIVRNPIITKIIDKWKK